MEAKELMNTFNEQHPNGSVEDLTKFIKDYNDRVHRSARDVEMERLHGFLSGLKGRCFVVYSKYCGSFEILRVVDPLDDTENGFMKCDRTRIQGLDSDQFSATVTQTDADVPWGTLIDNLDEYPIFNKERGRCFVDGVITEVQDLVYDIIIQAIGKKREEILAVSSMLMLEQFKSIRS